MPGKSPILKVQPIEWPLSVFFFCSHFYHYQVDEKVVITSMSGGRLARWMEMAMEEVFPG